MEQCPADAADGGAELWKAYTEKKRRPTDGGNDSSASAWCALSSVAVTAAVILAIVIIICYVVRCARGDDRSGRQGFYTEAGEIEAPTREWAPYTGTIGYGPWGVDPWALAASPHDRPNEYDWMRGLP